MYYVYQFITIFELQKKTTLSLFINKNGAFLRRVDWLPQVSCSQGIHKAELEHLKHVVAVVAAPPTYRSHVSI